MTIKKTLALLALLLGIGVMGYARVQLAEANQIYQEGGAVYTDISDRVRENAVVDATTPSVSRDRQPSVAEEHTVAAESINIPEIGINFSTLHAISEDAVAWLYCPGTVIDYPIMETDNYAYYLNHLPDGRQNANGSLFIDFNNAPDFREPLTVIYGHNMKSKMMFGSLAEYKRQRYYEEHPYMFLYTQDANYRIDLLYGCVIGAGQWRERSFMYKENVDALIAFAAHNSTFKSDAEYTEGDRIVAMSTCSYEFENARYVVIGILRGEDRDDINDCAYIRLP